MTFLTRLVSYVFPAAQEAMEPDLIDHPIFRAMSPRDLADLPFPRPAPREWSEDGIEAEATQPVEPYEIRPAA